MSIIDSVKDITRKATNSVVDTAENIINKPKSPKELAKRLVEHLAHQEYAKIAEILSEEAKKYASHLGIDDFALVETKLNDFKSSMEDVAEKLEEGDYSTVAIRIKEVEASIPDTIAGNKDIPTYLKSLLKDILKVIDGYNKDNKDSVANDGKKPDFSKLEDVFEGHFKKLVSK